MKNLFFPLLVIFTLFSCTEEQKTVKTTVKAVDFSEKYLTLTDTSLQKGETYLSIYPAIYNKASKKTMDLTSTVSMRNPNKADSVYITGITFYDTKGNVLKNYIEQPIFLGPMETLEIIIDDTKKELVTGSNFLFEWSVGENTIEPLFEGVMISTYGQQGLSFTTKGHRIK